MGIQSRAQKANGRLPAERVAYWYLRLNGFLTIENFLLHNHRGGSIRTDADILGVRFPHREEMVRDDPRGAMKDDDERLQLSHSHIDLVIAEVKTGRCALNGPWKAPEKKNIQQLLSAIGPVKRDRVENAAVDLYNAGYHALDDRMRLRLVAIGSVSDSALAHQFPRMTQVTWEGLLTFMHQRFQQYRDQKTHVDQWNCRVGKELRSLASRIRDCAEFVDTVMKRIGVSTPAASTHDAPRPLSW